MPRQAVPGDLSTQEKLQAIQSMLENADPRLDILVSLASDENPEVRRAAQQTLQSLPGELCVRLLQSPHIHTATASYFLSPERARPATLEVLLGHPASPTEAITALALSAQPSLIPILLAHLETLKTPALVALKRNPAYLEWQKGSEAADRPGSAAEVSELAARISRLVAQAYGSEPAARRTAQGALQALEERKCLDALSAIPLDPQVARYFLSHASERLALLPLLLAHQDTPSDAVAELAASAGPETVAVLLDQLDLLKTPALLALKENSIYRQWQKQPPAQGYVLEVDLLDLLIQEMESEHAPSEEEVQKVLETLSEEIAAEPEKGGVVNKIARMKVAQRVKLALLGTREERSLLIRDSSRVVCRAVLSSPKLSDSEVESFAAMRNVSQDVLRLISVSRKLMKSYTVVRCLANNPRTPLDVSLPLLNRLIPNDLRVAAASKDIPDTLRKMAKKLVEVRHQ